MLCDIYIITERGSIMQEVLLDIIFSLITCRFIILFTRVFYCALYKIKCRLLVRNLSIQFEPVSFMKTKSKRIIRLMSSGIHIILFIGVVSLILGFYLDMYTVKHTDVLTAKNLIAIGTAFIMYIILFHRDEIKRLLTLRYRRWVVVNKKDDTYIALSSLELAIIYMGFPNCHYDILVGVPENKVEQRYRIIDKDGTFLAALYAIYTEVYYEGFFKPDKKFTFLYSDHDIPNWEMLKISNCIGKVY